ncbi:MAG: R body protein [Ramlibacter sp.]|nr:R body protein [Ramlibacter sp.]
MSDALPADVVQAIAISNAQSIGEQPAILANMALANQVLNNNLQQQMLISQQQAMNQLAMATLAKAVSMILSVDSGPGAPAGNVKLALELVASMKQQFVDMQATMQQAAQANLEMTAKAAEQLKAAQVQN